MNIEEQLRNDAEQLRRIGWFNQADVYTKAADKIDELQHWKAEAIALQGEWNMQAIAELLGAQCGQSCLRVINERVPKLVEKVRQLEKAGDELSRHCDDALAEMEWEKAKQPIS